MLMPIHEGPVPDTTLLYVPYSFCCKVKVELPKESYNHFASTSPTKCKQHFETQITGGSIEHLKMSKK